MCVLESCVCSVVFVCLFAHLLNRVLLGSPGCLEVLAVLLPQPPACQDHRITAACTAAIDFFWSSMEWNQAIAHKARPLPLSCLSNSPRVLACVCFGTSYGQNDVICIWHYHDYTFSLRLEPVLLQCWIEVVIVRLGLTTKHQPRKEEKQCVEEKILVLFSDLSAVSSIFKNKQANKNQQLFFSSV